MTRPDHGTTNASDATAHESGGREPASGPSSGEVERSTAEIDGTAEATRSDSRAAASAHEELSVQEVRQRAVTGAAVDMLRGFGVRFIALIGTLVLARLLTPYDFGAIAIGTIFVTVGQFLADGGIGVGLIRRVDPPARADLRALLGFQLGFSTALAAVVIAVMLVFFGELGQVTAIMMIGLPLTAMRAPCVVVLERQLRYKPLALSDLVETVGYYALAIALVSVGWGVWGLASAGVVRALIGTTVLLSLVPSARVFPSLSWARIHPLLKFGMQFQAVGIVNWLRDLGTNAAIAILGGVSALGIWSVAYRILQIPLVFLMSVWRVSFPAMSKLVAAGENVGPTLERALAVTAVLSGVILAPLVAATPAWVPSLLGTQWDDAVAVIPPASLHLMVIGPISVAVMGYLFAVGDASAVLRSTLIAFPLMFVVMLPLLPEIGAAAVGYGWIAWGIGEGTVLVVSARKHADFRIGPSLLPPTLCAVAGASLGWFVADKVGMTVAGGLAGALLAFAVYLLSLWVVHRSCLLDAIRLSVRGARHVLKTPAPG
jgi:O-antigen/teichoic acid export membrane protein